MLFSKVTCLFMVVTLSLCVLPIIASNVTKIDVLPEPLIREYIVPFLDSNGTKVFRWTNQRNQRAAKARMDDIANEMMMEKYWEAIVSMNITIETFMHDFLCCDGLAFSLDRICHPMIAYNTGSSKKSYALMIRLKTGAIFRWQILTVQLKGGRFEGCLLMQGSLIRQIARRECRSILRNAYRGKYFSVPGVHGLFIRKGVANSKYKAEI